MTIDQLAPLTNGLSVHAGRDTFVLDRTRVARLSNQSIEIAFRIAGTDFAPRLRIARVEFASSSVEDLADIVRRVASNAVGSR